MRVLVLSTVHHPEDARILHREIAALVKAGHDVVHAAPFHERGVEPRPWVEAVDVPRALGRHRVRALRAARRVLRTEGVRCDVVVLHDPELLLAVPARYPVPVVWDVHEDTAAALSMKSWLPRVLRPVVRGLVHRIEARAERRHHLVLAEFAYTDRFTGIHPVAPNHTFVAAEVTPPDDDRVVHVGWLSEERGVEELLAVARGLAPHGIRTDLVGHADRFARPLLDLAVASGVVTWHGYLPNDEAMQVVDGALAGLSLLRDEPNYRHSLPSKVVEYMAHGVPVVTTPLPEAEALVRRGRSGVVVPFRDPDAVVAEVLALRADAGRRESYARSGHDLALAELDWSVAADTFVSSLETWAARP